MSEYKFGTWYPIDESQTEHHGGCLVCALGGFTNPVVGEAHYVNDDGVKGWWWANEHPSDYGGSSIASGGRTVTHFMPLPPPPSAAMESDALAYQTQNWPINQQGEG